MTHFEIGTWQQLREGVYHATLEPAGVNVGLVVGESACLLVDTGSSPEQGRELRASIAALTPVPLTTVVVTHHHWDHAYGLAAFADLETIGHETVAATLATPGAAARAEELGFDATELTPPSRPVTSIAARDLGGAHVEIGHFGAAHTQGDLTVLVPGRRVLFAGDLVEEGAPPGVDDTTSFQGWHRVLESVGTLCRPDTLVVPGHGAVVNDAYVNWQRAGLHAVWGQCEWLVQNGIKEVDAYSYQDLQWPWGEEWARAAIHRAYEELAAQGHVPRTQLPLRSL